MKPYLSKAAETLRNQINAAFVHRDRKSDGWISDYQHKLRKSDHNPLPSGEVCGLDIDAGLSDERGISYALADQIRLCAKSDKRISYIIHAKKIASRRSLWKWKNYTGINPHHSHLHISFKPDQDGKEFDIPLLKGN